MRTTSTIILVTAAFFLGGGIAALAWPRIVPQYADVCDVVRSPDRYDGQLLVVHARVVGEDHHGYALVSPDCRQGLGLDHVRGQRDVQYEIFEGSRISGGLPHDFIEGVFIGRFKYSRGNESCCTLVVREVRDLYSGPDLPHFTPSTVVFRVPPTPTMIEPSDTLVKVSCDVMRDGSLNMCLPKSAVIDDSIWKAISAATKPVRLAPHAKDRSTTAGRSFEFSLRPAGPSAR